MIADDYDNDNNDDCSGQDGDGSQFLIKKGMPVSMQYITMLVYLFRG